MTPRSVLEQGEMEKGYGVWEGDLYGVGSVLGGKRELRGWEERALEIFRMGNEEGVDALLEWNGGADGKGIYKRGLPWDE